MLILIHLVQLGHQTFISIGERPICDLRFAADIDLMGGKNVELQDLTNRLVDRATAYGMEVSTEKSKIMTNSTSNVSAIISMKCQKIEEVTSLKYLEQPCARMAPAQQKSASELPK